MFRDKHGRALSAQELIGKSEARFYAIFEELMLFVIHCLATIPSHTLRKFFYALIGIKIGAGSVVHRGASLYTLGKIKIGTDTIIGEKATLDGRGGLKIGNHVDIASEVMIYTSQHDLNSPFFAPVDAGVTIEDYVFIGPRAIILPGVTIGKGAAIGAGAVVTKSIPAFTVVGGVPAREIAKRELHNPNYLLGRVRLFR